MKILLLLLLFLLSKKARRFDVHQLNTAIGVEKLVPGLAEETPGMVFGVSSLVGRRSYPDASCTAPRVRGHAFHPQALSLLTARTVAPALV